MSMPPGDPLQRLCQGALLCQDWPGLQAWRKTIPPDFYLAASDIPDDARLGDLIAFFFGPYTAGTPHNDDFPPLAMEPPRPIASESFVAALPQRLPRPPQRHRAGRHRSRRAGVGLLVHEQIRPAGHGPRSFRDLPEATH